MQIYSPTKVFLQMTYRPTYVRTYPFQLYLEVNEKKLYMCTKGL